MSCERDQRIKKARDPADSLIQPGQYQDVTVTFDAYDLASYDYSDANGNGFKGYEIEAG